MWKRECGNARVRSMLQGELCLVVENLEVLDLPTHIPCYRRLTQVTTHREIFGAGARQPLYPLPAAKSQVSVMTDLHQ